MVGESAWGESNRRWRSWVTAAAEVVPAMALRRDQCWRAMRSETAAKSRPAAALIVWEQDIGGGSLGDGSEGR